MPIHKKRTVLAVPTMKYCKRIAHNESFKTYTQTHKYTFIYIYIYMYTYIHIILDVM